MTGVAAMRPQHCETLIALAHVLLRRCYVLLCVAVLYSVLQCVAVCYSVLQHCHANKR